MSKRKAFILILILCIFIVGCNSKEKQVQNLLEEAEKQLEEDNISGAIETYEEILNVTNDSQYQSKIDELKIKQEEKDKIEKDIAIVNKTIDELKNILFNPDSLQVNKVIIYRDDSWASVYMDYSAMNKMGGYARDYAYAAFSNEKLQPDSFFPSFESNYRSAEKDLDGNETYYFDIELLKLNN